MAKKRIHINLVGNRTAIPIKRRIKVIKAKARRGGKLVLLKAEVHLGVLDNG